MIENIDFFGITISSFTEEELWINVDKDILNKSSAVYYCTGFYNIILLEKYPELYLYSSKVNVILMDGHLFNKFLNILGYKIKYELSMPRFVLSLLEHLNSDKKVFALGGDNQVNCLAMESIVNKYKITNVAGRNGYFKESEELEIVNEINNFAPDILLIGISSPIKERFFYKWKSELKVGIIVPCGGMLDVLANKTKITPLWIKKIGLAMVYRVIQEPKRLLKSRLYVVYQVFFRIVPVLLFKKYILHDNLFFLPSLFGIKK